MANLVSKATGNWSTAGTWALVDSTTYLNAESNNELLSTTESSNRAAAGTTPGAITIYAIALKIATRAASPTGTMSVQLWNVTDVAAVAGTSVTVNVSDLPLCTAAAADGGWFVFKFAAPVTLTAGKAYIASPVTSSANQVNLFRNATGDNWSKMLLTTTTQAPVAGDDVVVTGEWTAAATGSSFTVTMNSTTNTDYGSNTTSEITPAVAITKNGTLAFDSTSAFNPYLRLSGALVVYAGGTLTIGTVATPIPRNSVAILEFDCSADSDFGLACRNLGTVNAVGLSRTSGKDVVWCLLNTDEAIASTSLGVDTDTGWLDNDVIAVASTTQTATQCETGALNGNAGASSLTVDGFAGAGGGLAFAHSGTSPTQAEVVMLTRNVKIRPVTSTNGSYVFAGTTATVVYSWVEFPNLFTGTAPKNAFALLTTTGSASVTYCSFYNSERDCVIISGSTVANITIQHCVFYNSNTANANTAAIVGGTPTGTVTIDDCVLIRGLRAGVVLASANITFTNIRIAGFTGNNIDFSVGNTQFGTWSNIVSHSSAANGMAIAGGEYGTITNLSCWRNGAFGIDGRGLGSSFEGPTVLVNYVAFGNASRGIILGTTIPVYVRFVGGILASDTTFTQVSGISLTQSVQSGAYWIVCEGVQFSPSTGIFADNTNDLDLDGGPTGELQMWCNNCLFGSTNQISVDRNAISIYGFVHSTRHNQTDGDLTWMRHGTTLKDTSIFNSTPHSIRMTPLSASVKMPHAHYGEGLTVPVTNGVAITLSAQVRKSAAGDGAAYNGNQPRLMVRANPAIGVSTDTVVATYASGTGSWNLLTGTSPTPTADGFMEVFFDCDGTAGWVNVDDIDFDGNSLADNWNAGLPMMAVGGGGGGERFSAAIGL